MRVHANCAMTLDGAIGMPGPKSLRISSQEDLVRVHRLRAESDAILVGVGTVLADDPKLDVKWKLVGRQGSNPLRVVLDSHNRVPESALVMDERAPSLLFHGPQGPQGARHMRVPESSPGRLDLRKVLEALAVRGVKSLMVEGGQAVLTSFLAQELVDVFSVYVAPRILGLQEAPRIASSPHELETRLRLDRTERMGEGVVLWFVRAN